MELVEGESLRELLNSGSIDLPRILMLAGQICQGLGAAHKGSVVHRDIKPSNVVIDTHGNPKVLDFGLATIQGSANITQAGSTLGTVRYMSPEQIEGRSVDNRSDLFSFGVMLYEMITGRTPFERNSNAATFKAITLEKPEPIAQFRHDIPDGLQYLVDKLLEKDREQRYQDMEGVSRDLRRIEFGGLTKIPERPSIAVLPFTNMSTDKEQEFFCDGIAEDILNDLTKIDKLRVVSRTSSFAFKGKTEDMRDVGRKLNAGTILEGSVRKSGNRLRITAQLIDVADGYHMWSERFDRELDDVFAIQDEISNSIVQALRIKLDSKQELQKNKVPTKSIEAYELYLRGRIFLHRSGKNWCKYAIELFSHAIAKDPEYALAYAGLADSHSQAFLYFGKDQSNLDGALEASMKALELDPNLAEAHAARGHALSLGEQYGDAETEFERAIELNPNLYEAHYLYARTCFIQEDYEAACRHFEQAGRVKPDDYQSPLLASSAYRHLNQPEAAKESSRRGLEIARKHLELNPNDARAVYLSAGALADLGKTKQALEWSARAALMEPDDPAVLYNTACLYSGLDHVDEAVSYLQKAIDCGFSAREWMESDPDLDPIRNHPEYKDLLKRISDER
jgi:TolB-like protein/Flp pilus assembly protein TadD